MRRVVGCLVLLVLALAAPLSANEKPTKAQLDAYRRDGSLPKRIAAARDLRNDKASPALVARLQNNLQRLRLRALGKSAREIELLVPPLPPGAGAALASTGTQRIFALLIDFPDYPYKVPADQVNAALFGNGRPADYPYESLHNYYQRASYGQLDIEGATLGYYRPSYNRTAVGHTQAGREALIKEALTYFHDQQGHNFSQYDNDKDGAIDYFCVFWTGPDEGWSSFWWGYKTSWSSDFSLDGVRFQGAPYSWQWVAYEEGTVFEANTVIHETGHGLGLPDLYDYDDAAGPMGGVGGVDMMDANIGDHNAFSKWMLDWLTPAVSSNGQTHSLRPSGTNPDAVIMWPGFSVSEPFTEFFIAQARTRVANDNDPTARYMPYGFPGAGLMIWHIDATLNPFSGDFLFDNSYTDHKLVRLMEADGQEAIEQYYWADAGDFYRPGNSFGNNTWPASVGYTGRITNVGVRNITASGTLPDVTYSFLSGDTSPALVVNATRLDVPEGGSATFNVKLSSQPSGPVTVTIAKASGGDQFSVGGAATLTFGANTWSVPQVVVIAAAEDPDATDDVATFTVASAGMLGRTVTATQHDNDVARAAYSSTYSVPACTATAAGCDSGDLLRGVDGMSGYPEPNEPNTLYNGCADGTDGVYGTDEMIEKIHVATVDGTAFAPGKAARIDVTLFSTWPDDDRLDLYYTGNANANPPAWTYLTTLYLNGSGLQTLSAQYTLPAGGVQAVRAKLRYGGDAKNPATYPCASGDYDGAFDDQDDLVFAASGVMQPAVMASATQISIAEGSTGTVRVHLTAPPPAPVTVTVARMSGDTDVSVTSGATLTFTPADWSAPKTVTFAAAEDVDNLDGSASFQLAGPGLVAADLTVTELDNEVAHAGFDQTLNAPQCLHPTAGCDSGDLLRGVDGMQGYSEVNQPNTLYGACADGTEGVYLSDEMIERIRVSTDDGSPLTTGRPAAIHVTVFSTYASDDSLDLFYTNNAGANPPVWKYLVTLKMDPDGDSLQTLSTTYTLPSGALQAIRAQFRYGGLNTADGLSGVISPAPASCTTGGYVDHDDLVFAPALVSMIVTSADTVPVPEGGAQTLHVRLSAPPSGPVTVNVARVAGDSDITVFAGASLDFTVGNWNVWQGVTLKAAEDADLEDGEATIRLTAAGMPLTDVIATEVDNDLARAAYDNTLKAPKCATPGAGCDAGDLLKGVDGMVDYPESHQPNTLYASCQDGTVGDYLEDEMIERLRVATVDGTPMAPGKMVRIDARVFVSIASEDYLDLYYTADATANPPVWTYIATVPSPGDGFQTLSATYTLPAGTVQAVRAKFRWEGNAHDACANGTNAGGYDDHDDLAFVVGSAGVTPALVVASSAVTVPEGGTAVIQVKLRAAPATTVSATISRVSGDTDISLSGASVLTFTPANWDTYQAVTLRAADDTDTANGTTIFRLTAAGLADLDVTATEADNDSTPGLFTDQPLTAGMPVRAVHITELRGLVAALRSREGLAPATWTDDPPVPGVTVVKAAHITELRAALADVYTSVGTAAPTYSRVTIAPGAVVSAVDIAELRAAVLAIW